MSSAAVLIPSAQLKYAPQVLQTSNVGHLVSLDVQIHSSEARFLWGKNYDQVRQFQYPVRQFYCLARQLQYVSQVLITLSWRLPGGPQLLNTSENVDSRKHLVNTSPVWQFQYSVRQFYCLARQLQYVPQVLYLVVGC